MTNQCAVESSALREHWQGHRRLTRRVIQAFPADKLFTFSVGGMRPFGVMALELIHMATEGVKGLASGQWPKIVEPPHHKKIVNPPSTAEILRQWDEATAQIEAAWPRIRSGRFQDVEVVFGEYEMPMHAAVLYWVDNEIHHRGQGFVYLRALNIEPPPFYSRD